MSEAVSEAMCCPLSQADEYATVYNCEERVARKEHKCCECGDAIPARARYEHISMLFDGTWTSHRLCLLCREIGDHFACGNGRILETLWSDLEENFFRDMRAGGRCMVGLSPAAKQRLIDKRMEWYLEQDEVDDSQWDGWTPDKPPRPLPAPTVERGVLRGNVVAFDDREPDRDPFDPAGNGWG